MYNILFQLVGVQFLKLILSRMFGTDSQLMEKQVFEIIFSLKNNLWNREKWEISQENVFVIYTYCGDFPNPTDSG